MIQTNTRTLILMTTLALVLLGAAGGSAFAQTEPVGKDAGCSPTVANPCGGSSGSSSSGSSGSSGEAGARLRRWTDCKFFGKGCPPKTDKRVAAGQALNDKGVEAYERSEWANAVSFFQQALENIPDNEIFRENLVNARNRLAAVEAKENADRERQLRAKAAAEEERRSRNKAAVDSMQQSIQDFAKTLGAPPVSGGLDFDGPVSTDAAKGGSKGDGLDFTFNTDASVVDLRDAKTLTVDPSRVKGTLAGEGSSRLMTPEDLKSMSVLARTLGWTSKEQERLAIALEAMGRDGNPDVTLRQVDETWTDVRTRENDPAFGIEAARVNGVGFPGAGTQTTNDCTIFALANVSGLTYGGAAARATKLISEGEWRDPAERANPESVFKTGLNGHEVIMLAEAFGEAEVVASPAFVATLKEGRPILLGVSVTEIKEHEYREYFHEVVLTKSFQFKGETWFEMMDSNQPPTARRYLSAKELDVIMIEKGVAFRADAGTKPQLLH